MPQNYLFFTCEREYVIKEQESGLMIVLEPFWLNIHQKNSIFFEK